MRVKFLYEPNCPSLIPSVLHVTGNTFLLFLANSYNFTQFLTAIDLTDQWSAMSEAITVYVKLVVAHRADRELEVSPSKPRGLSWRQGLSPGFKVGWVGTRADRGFCDARVAQSRIGRSAKNVGGFVYP